jgi:hypothetical protein
MRDNLTDLDQVEMPDLWSRIAGGSPLPYQEPVPPPSTRSRILAGALGGVIAVAAIALVFAAFRQGTPVVGPVGVPSPSGPSVDATDSAVPDNAVRILLTEDLEVGQMSLWTGGSLVAAIVRSPAGYYALNVLELSCPESPGTGLGAEGSDVRVIDHEQIAFRCADGSLLGTWDRFGEPDPSNAEGGQAALPAFSVLVASNGALFALPDERIPDPRSVWWATS